MTEARDCGAYLESLFGLTGRRAVVTGGTGGLGSAIAEGLACAGASVIVVGRDPDRAHDVVSSIRDRGGNAELALADLTDDSAVSRLAETIIREHGKVDILVNAAGVDPGPAPTVDADLDTVRAIYNVNVVTTLACCQAFGRGMLERGEGWIVNVGSTDGLLGVPRGAAYGASKAAIGALTRTLALEWIGRGVYVNAIAPTEFDTPMIAHLAQDPEYQTWVGDAIPIGRVGRPPEVVGAVLLLVSPAGSMLVGHTLTVDGGRTII